MVIIIPGILNKPNFYKPTVEKLQQRGLSVSIIDLGSNWQSIKKASEIVYKSLTLTPEKKDIIAHSRGGIIIKYLLLKHPETQNSQR